MSKGRDTKVLLCMRIGDAPLPALLSRQEVCRDCGEDVWVASPVEADSYLCLQCGGDMMKSEQVASQVHPLVREQLQRLGWTDEQIDAVSERMDAKLRGHRHGPGSAVV